MLLPNKKLLKEVLKNRFQDVVIDGCVINEKNDNTLKIFMNICFCYEINIHELAHKCKEWALSKGYIVDERGVNVFLLTSDGIDVVWKSYGKPFCPYRVFEPCEWIMEQTK